MRDDLARCYAKALSNVLHFNQGVVVTFNDKAVVVYKSMSNGHPRISVIPLSEVSSSEEYEEGDILNLKFNTGSWELH